jgi:hypothetical protein
MDFPGSSLLGQNAFLPPFFAVETDYPQKYKHNQGSKKKSHQEAEKTISHRLSSLSANHEIFRAKDMACSQ